jgi:hypothetical protein
VVVMLTLREAPAASVVVVTLPSGVSAAVMVLSVERYHRIVGAGALAVPWFATVALSVIDCPSLAVVGPDTAVIVRSTGWVEVTIVLPARLLLASLVSMIALLGSTTAPMKYVPAGRVVGIGADAPTMVAAPPARAGTETVASKVSVVPMAASLDR